VIVEKLTLFWFGGAAVTPLAKQAHSLRQRHQLHMTRDVLAAHHGFWL